MKKLIGFVVSIFLLSLILFSSSIAFSGYDTKFNLSTPKIFGSKDEDIYINFSGKNVRYVDIKIYKLKDPLHFIINSKYKKNLRSYKFSYKLDLKERILNNIWEKLNDIQYSIRAGLRKSLPYEVRDKIKEILGLEDFTEFSPPEPPLNERVNRFLRDEEVISFFREYIPRPKEKGWWSYKRIALPIKDIGTYLIEGSYNGKVAYTLLIVNDISIAVKLARNSNKLLVFLEDKYNSLPIKGGNVYIVRRDEVLAKGKTDQNGIYKLDNTNFSFKNLSFITTYKDQITITDTPYFYGSNENIEIYTYTDRPIYKPGHTIYFKSIIRKSGIYNYLLPIVGKKVKVSLRDPDYNLILKEEKEIDEFGTISGKINLSEDVATGYYTISIDFDGSKSSAYFLVEEYEKPEYKVDLSSPKDLYEKGENIDIKVSAKYYFGEPLGGGSVEYQVFAYPLYGYYGDYEEKYVKEGKGVLDKNGEYHIILTPKDLKGIPNSEIYVNVYVKDWKNKLVSQGYNFSYRVTKFLLEVSADRYIYSEDDRVTLKIKAFDIRKKPVTTPALLIIRRVFWRNDERVEKIEKMEEIKIEDGEKDYIFQPTKTGSYEIEVYAEDSEKNEVKAYEYVWVSGPDFRYATDTIKFITDKEKYKQGDTIHAILILPKENVTGLYTLEGKDIYEYRVLKVDGNTLTLNIPLSKSYLGDVKIKFLFFQGGRYYTGYYSLPVENIRYKLSIDILPDKKTYKPGEDGYITLKVKDAKGDGVKAELSVGIVDESIYALTYDSEDDIFDYFYTYASNYYDVGTSVSYYFNFYGSAFQEAILETKKDKNPLADFKEEAAPMGGRGGTPSPYVRKFFPDTMYFNPKIVTDENGIARIKVKFPDSLTSFRITAKAVTKDTLVGQSKKNVTVRKEIFSRMDIPPFAVEGDEVYIGSIVHNYTKKDKDLNVVFKPDQGITLLEGTNKKEFVVPSGQEKMALFKVRFKDPGLRGIRADVSEGNFIHDALLRKIYTYPYGYHVKKTLSGILREKNKTISITLPEDVQSNTVKAVFELDTSLINSLIPSFRYLIDYPYGCTEQTMSKLLPDIAVRGLLDLYNLHPKGFEELDKMIIKGMRKLYRYQHDDGGWGWWEFDDSSPIQTAYVLFGLELLKDNGYLVSDNALSRGYEYLMNQVSQEDVFDDLSHPEKGFVLYMLTLWKGSHQDERKLIEKLSIDTFEDIRADKEVPSITLAYIALAFKNLGEKELLDQSMYEIENRKKSSNGYIYWEGYNQDYLYITDVETTSWIGFVLLSISPSNPLLDDIARYLLDYKTGDNWINTKTTAISLLFLADYLKQKRDRIDAWAFTIKVGNKILKYNGTKGKTITIPLDIKEIGNIDNIEIQKEGRGVGYYRVYLDYWKDSAPEESNIGIDVKYYRLISHVMEKKRIFSKEKIDGNIKLNDTILSEIEINSPHEYYNVIIEVPRPAGFEYIKDDWNYNIADEEENTEEEDLYWYIYKEYRKNRVVFFVDYIPKGISKFSYIARARMKGKFNILPSHLTLMYDPKIKGFGNKGSIEITQ